MIKTVALKIIFAQDLFGSVEIAICIILLLIYALVRCQILLPIHQYVTKNLKDLMFSSLNDSYFTSNT